MKFTAEKQAAKLKVNGTISSEILCQGSKDAGVVVTLGTTAKIEKGLKVSAMVVKIVGQIAENLKLKVTLTTKEAQLDSEVPVAVSMEKEASGAKIWLSESAAGSTLDYAAKDMEVQINTKVEVTTTVAGEATAEGGKIEANTNGTVDAATNGTVEGSEKLPDEGATMPDAPADSNNDTDNDNDNTGNGDDNNGDNENPAPTGDPSITLQAAKVTSGSSVVVVVTASAFKLGETEVSGATFANTASCGGTDSTSASNGVYTFAETVTGELTFTVTADNVTYTVTATVGELTEEASGLTATVTANTDSGASQS